jgi:adenylate cyclase
MLDSEPASTHRRGPTDARGTSLSFWGELRRRKVIRVALAYLVVAWLLVQIATTIEPALDLPSWFDTFVIVVTAIGFPIAVVLAWAFDITPDGLRRTAPVAVGGADDSPAAAHIEPPVPAPVARPAPIAAERSVAVLPFVNMSPDPDQEYFSDGLSEELLNQLAQIKDLRVAARTSSFCFKGQSVDLKEVAQKLGVSHVLEGSVRKAGSQLRITAQLISAADGYHLWSETYARTLDDVFAIQDEIARAVANALSVTLGIRATTSAADLTDDVETYDLYLRGRGFFHRSGPADFARAAELYGEALARDPGFSRARAALVHGYAFMAMYVPERRVDALHALELAAGEGRERAGDDWATYLASALAHMYRYEWTDAEAAFEEIERRAAASVPEVLESRILMLLNLGRAADAAEVIEATISSDPLSCQRSFMLQYALGMLGKDAEAEAEYQRSLELPGSDTREDIRHWALMRIWNDEDAALVEARFDDFLSRQTIPTPWIEEVRAVHRDPQAALEIVRAAHEDPVNQDPTRQMFSAAYAGHFGDVELALASLRRALADMHGGMVHVVWFPDLARTRRTEGFKILLRDIGLVDYWYTTGNWGDFCRPAGDGDVECV